MKRLHATINLFLILLTYMPVEASLLEAEIGAKAVSMGGAYVGLARGLDALNYNSAGLASFRGKEFSAIWLKGLADTNYGLIGYIKNCFALTLTTLQGGEIQINYPDTTTKTLIAEQDYLLSMGYGKKITNKISLGLCLKDLQSELVQEIRGQAFVLDFGLMYLLQEGTNIGFSIQNLGTQIIYKGGIATGDSGDVFPLMIRTGVGHSLINKGNFQFIGAIDILKPQNEDIKVHIGFEYQNKQGFALRCGYKSKYDLESFSFGFGVKIKNYQIDYGLSLMGNLGLTHRVSFIVQL